MARRLRTKSGTDFYLLIKKTFYVAVEKITSLVILLEDLNMQGLFSGNERIRKDYSSRCIMRLVPFFILEKVHRTNNNCLPKFFQKYNASSSLKTAIG